MVTKFLREEEGQTTVEYLLIIAVIVVVISVLGKGLRDKLPQTIDAVFGGVNGKIKELMSAGAGR
jgi:Flp pilus assembly pilin Flp